MGLGQDCIHPPPPTPTPNGLNLKGTTTTVQVSLSVSLNWGKQITALKKMASDIVIINIYNNIKNKIKKMAWW